MSYMHNNSDFIDEVCDLAESEIDAVYGSSGVAGAAIGTAIGGVFGEYQYIAGQIGSSNGSGATFGGVISSIGFGALGGAVAGGSGTWVGGVAGAAIGVGGGYVAGRFDAAHVHHK